MVDTFVKLIPRGLLDRSGSVFYSGRCAFQHSSPLYILGLNPGGDPEIQAEETVQWHTNKVLRRVPDNWSAYRDESWAGSAPGTRGMQPRVLHLLRRININPGNVPASNLVFLRSGREDRLQDDLSQLVEDCWPFHQKVIEDLNVRVVLCFGKTSGKWVCKYLNAHKKVEEFVECNNRRWRSRSFKNANGITVVVATHPSIADWTASATDPTELVANAIRAQCRSDALHSDEQAS